MSTHRSYQSKVSTLPDGRWQWVFLAGAASMQGEEPTLPLALLAVHEITLRRHHGVLHDARDRGYTDGQAQRRKELERACSELNPSASDAPATPPPPPLPPPGRPNTSAIE